MGDRENGVPFVKEVGEQRRGCPYRFLLAGMIPC